MTKTNRMLSLLLACALIMGVAAVPVSAASFQDTEGHWAEDAIAAWAEYGVVSGYDGSFRPNDAVTRAEFSVMLNKIMQYIERGENTFTDLQSGDWYADAMLKLHAAGVLSGADGKALPKQAITRQEAAVLIAKTFQLAGGTASDAFADEAAIAPWATESVQALASRGIIQGLMDGGFHPEAPLTRAAAVTIFDQLLHRLITEPGEYSLGIAGNLAVNADDVVLKDMRISGDLYIAPGVGEGEVTLNNVEIEGTVFVQGGGENSIIFNNVDVKGALVVNKHNGKIRILATGNTSVSVTLLESGAMLVTKELTGGGFDTVEISADVMDGSTVTLDGNFNKVVNRSASAEISANGQIRELVAETDTKVTGNVQVDKVSGNEASQVTVNDNVVDADGTAEAAEPATGGTTPAGGGGSGGNDDDDSEQEQGQVAALSLAKYASAAVDQNAQLDAAVLANSSSVAIGETVSSLYEEHGFDATIVAEDALAQAGNQDVPVVNVVVSLTDAEGQPLADTADITATVTGATYTAAGPTVTSATYSFVPAFGQYLADGYKEGSFVYSLYAGNPETIQNQTLTIAQGDESALSLSLLYVPAGTAYVTAIQPITGDTAQGSRVTAGDVQIAGTPANTNMTYTWLRADQAEGPYTVIEGATARDYVLTEEDGGKYLRVEAAADQVEVAGKAISEPFGPVEQPIDASLVFEAIEAAYLAENADAQNVISDLNLMSGLAAFPGVAIAWESDNTAAVSLEGVVARSEENDQFVTLIATISGSFGSQSKTFAVIVRANGTDHVDTGDFIDPYFVDGYPQAYIKEGTIWIRYQLRQPADVYMVINAINGHIESSVKSVLEGHAGLDGDIVYVDAWPYIKAASADQLHDFNTGVTLDESRPSLIEMVVQDSAQQYTSAEVTTILFDQETISALDTNPPYAYDFYINNALDAIYFYFDEPLDSNSVPAADEFSLNVGQVDNVAIYNYADHYPGAYVKLDVSGIVQADVATLELSYAGTSIQDQSDFNNQAPAFDQESVVALTESISRVTIASDRKHMVVEFVPGWYPDENDFTAAERFTIQVEGQGEYHPEPGVNYSYSIGEMTQYLTFANPLPEGAVTVKVNMEGIIDWARDAYPLELVSQSVEEIAAPGTPTAAYDALNGQLALTFAEGFMFDNETFNAAGLILLVDGVEYGLRGFIAEEEGNVLSLDLTGDYEEHFRAALEAGTSVQVKYTKANGDNDDQLADAAGALLPDFGFVEVVK